MRMQSKLIFLTLCVMLSSARASGTTGAFREKLATVMFAGIGGAVLGLSTLSFYGEPQEKIGNITTGFVLGLVGGSVFVASQNMVPHESAALRPYVPKLSHQPPMFIAEFSF